MFHFSLSIKYKKTIKKKKTCKEREITIPSNYVNIYKLARDILSHKWTAHVQRRAFLHPNAHLYNEAEGRGWETSSFARTFLPELSCARRVYTVTQREPDRAWVGDVSLDASAGEKGRELSHPIGSPAG